jgi:hypothetical protein
MNKEHETMNKKQETSLSTVVPIAIGTKEENEKQGT